MVIRLLALVIVVIFLGVGTRVVFAEPPTPISILIEQKITVGDENNSQVPTRKFFEVTFQSIESIEGDTAVPAKEQRRAEPKSVDKKPSIKSTVTPISVSARGDRKSPFSRGTGSVNEEEPAESGSCNSASGYEGLALMSVLLIPGVIKYRRRKG